VAGHGAISGVMEESGLFQYPVYPELTEFCENEGLDLIVALMNIIEPEYLHELIEKVWEAACAYEADVQWCVHQGVSYAKYKKDMERKINEKLSNTSAD
jgi:hypothetical protein